MDLNKIPELINKITEENYSMADKELFNTVLRNYKSINAIQGDTIECGVWRGGFSVFLSHLFVDRKIWVCDSFGGFQSFGDADYKKLTYFDEETEQLTERFQKENDLVMNIPLRYVKGVFKYFGLVENERINFVKGFVNKTLPNIKIDKIALLRVDVDGYSPTREVLDNLYHKVEKGGMIIFDDLCLVESAEGVKDWMIEKNLPLEVHNPYDDSIYSLKDKISESETGYHTGSYIIKK